MTLEKGEEYKLTVLYFENTGLAGVQLEYQSPKADDFSLLGVDSGVCTHPLNPSSPMPPPPSPEPPYPPLPPSLKHICEGEYLEPKAHNATFRAVD